MTLGLHLRASAFTHQGALRPTNEDTIAVGDWLMSEPMAAPALFELEIARPLICLVADGMGGHPAGEVASRVVAERLAQHAVRAGDEAALTALLGDVNAELFELMRERPTLFGMGTTVAGVSVGPARAIIFNVGDSRVYGIGPRGLEQLSTDDTPGPKLADGRTAAMTSHLITRTMGGAYLETGLEPHLLSEPLDRRRRYLICSDGLSDLLNRTAIEVLLDDDDAASIEALFEAAMARGGRDNISIVMLDVRPS
jgi:PPM family protein phosphatase